MCLAIPAQILQINGDVAKVDFGHGIVRDVNITLVDTRVGEYVLVHAGFAINVVNQRDAEETLQLWDELLAKSESTAP